jgi:hypothetical protein
MDRLGGVLSELDFRRQIGHCIVDELFAQFREFVPLLFVESGDHWLRSAILRAPFRSPRDKVALIVCFPMLADDAAGAQISDQKLVQIGIGRVLSNGAFSDLGPDCSSGDAITVIDGTNDPKMQIRIVLEPIEIKTNDVVARDSRSSRISENIRTYSRLVCGGRQLLGRHGPSKFGEWRRKRVQAAALESLFRERDGRIICPRRCLVPSRD